jgi:hypothetical protein
MRFTTDALPSDVRDIAPEAMRVERDKGMTTFTVRESDAAIVASEIHRAGYTVTAGGPRVSYSAPRAYATASSHIRRW